MPKGPESGPGRRRESRRSKKIPEWAERQRAGDLSWIAENLHIFWPAAQEQYQAQGRGIIAVETNVIVAQESGQMGHPIAYLTQEIVEQSGDEDANRMLQAYDPETEMVIVLLKVVGMSTYRIRIPGLGQEDQPGAPPPSSGSGSSSR